MTSPPADRKPDLELKISTTRAEVDAMAGQARAPVLQVGSRVAKVDGVERSWRNLLRHLDFTGLDIAAGDNVDVVADLTAPFDTLDGALGGRRYNFIICQHVLEHVRQPWIAADNLTRLLAEDGLLYVATPWVQSFHGYPNDYWRFSFAGLRELFPSIEFFDMYWSGTGAGVDAAYKMLVDGRIDLERTPYEVEGELFQIVAERDWNLRQPGFQKLGRLPLARAYMPVLFVNVLGRRRR